MRRFALLATAVMVIAFSSCGTGSPSSLATPGTTAQTTGQVPTTSMEQMPAHGATTCTPSGTALSITAKNVKFDKACLAAPANQPFTITLDNQDNGVAHSIVILPSHTSPTTLFGGQTVTGPAKFTYNIGALPAGTYHFHCSVHPNQMNGDFIVQ